MEINVKGLELSAEELPQAKECIIDELKDSIEKEMPPPNDEPVVVANVLVDEHLDQNSLVAF